MKHQIRIIAGSARGRWLYSPDSDATRPMLGRVKNSLFNIISHRFHGLEGALVLDLFAGTGALGLEALSRGTKRCIFIEKNKQTFQILQKNISLLGFNNQSETVYLNVLHGGSAVGMTFYIIDFLKEKKFSPDIIFISPPYRFFDDTAPEKDRLLEIMDEFVKENILNKNGLIIIEHQKKQLQGLSFKYLVLYKERTYGDITLGFFKTA